MRHLYAVTQYIDGFIQIRLCECTELCFCLRIVKQRFTITEDRQTYYRSTPSIVGRLHHILDILVARRGLLEVHRRSLGATILDITRGMNGLCHTWITIFTLFHIAQCLISCFLGKACTIRHQIHIYKSLGEARGTSHRPSIGIVLDIEIYAKVTCPDILTRISKLRCEQGAIWFFTIRMQTVSAILHQLFGSICSGLKQFFPRQIVRVESLASMVFAESAFEQTYA